MICELFYLFKLFLLLQGTKTCAVGELPWRLTVIMCIILHMYGEFAAAQFWYEFIEELRFRWNKSLRLLGYVIDAYK